MTGRFPPDPLSETAPLDIQLSDSDVVVAHRERSLIVVWRGETRASFVDDIHTWLAAQRRRDGDELFAMTAVFEATVKPPKGEMRKLWADSMKRTDPCLAMLVNCLPATGFKAAMVRSAFSAINLMQKPPFEAHVTAKIGESALLVARKFHVDANGVALDIERARKA